MSKIGNAMSARREQLGMNQNELASRTGISQQTISKLESGLTVKPHKWRNLARALKFEESEFAKLIDDTAFEFGSNKRATQLQRNVSRRLSEINAPFFTSVKRVPIMGRAAAGAPGKLIMLNKEYDSIEMPIELVGVDGGYAVYVYDDLMSPRYRAGEMLFVNPYKPVKAGDYCVIQIGKGDDMIGYVKQYVSSDEERMHFRQINPPLDIVFGVGEISAVHRVVGMRE